MDRISRIKLKSINVNLQMKIATVAITGRKTKRQQTKETENHVT